MVAIRNSLDMERVDGQKLIRDIYPVMEKMVPPDEIDTLDALLDLDKISRKEGQKTKLCFFGLYNDDNKAIGFASCSVLPDGSGFHVYLGVDPEERKKGLGKQLQQAMRDWAKQHYNDLEEPQKVNFIEVEPPGQESANERIRAFSSMGYGRVVLNSDHKVIATNKGNVLLDSKAANGTYSYESPSNRDTGGYHDAWLGVDLNTLPKEGLSRETFLRMTVDLHNQLNEGAEDYKPITYQDLKNGNDNVPRHLINMRDATEGMNTLTIVAFNDPKKVISQGERTLSIEKNSNGWSR